MQPLFSMAIISIKSEVFFFFSWEVSWGKVLTLDQLQNKGWSLANKCLICAKIKAL